MQLKYSFNRSYLLSMVLIHIREISILSVLLVSAFAPFYQDLFKIIAFTPPYSASIVLFFAIFNALLVLFTIAPIWSKLSFLKPIWFFSTFFLKMFPYIFLVPTLTYSIGSILNNGLLEDAIFGTINTIFIFLYILIH